MAIRIVLVALALMATRVRRSHAARVTLVALALLVAPVVCLAFSLYDPDLCC